MRYSDDRTIFWRFGTPHITETFLQHYGGGRGSGHYGTGLYAYDSATTLLKDYQKRLQKIAHYKEALKTAEPSSKYLILHPDPKTTETVEKSSIEHMIYCKIDASYLRFYEPLDLNALNEFSKALTNFTWYLENAHERKIDLSSIKEDYGEYAKIITLAEKLNAIDGDQLAITPEHIDQAINATLQCNKEKGVGKCSLPINHILHKNAGFDGVRPHPEYGNRNHEGNVIFRESLKRVSELHNDIAFDDLSIKDNIPHTCEFNPISEHDRRYEQIDTYLVEEQRDPYIQIEETIDPTTRKDFIEMLQQSIHQSKLICDKKACEKIRKPIDIIEKRKKIDEIALSCTHWDSDPNQSAHCQQLANYWKSRINT